MSFTCSVDQLAGAHGLVDQLFELGDGELVNFPALDLHELLAIGDQRLAERKPAAGNTFHGVRARAVGMEGTVEQPAGGIGGSLENHRARAVAKKNATGSVGVIRDSAERFGADDQDILELPGAGRNSRRSPGRK